MVLLLMTISNSFVVRPRIIHHSHENKTLKMISSQVPPSRPKSTSFMFLEWLLLHNFKAGKIVTSFLHDSPTCLCYTVVIPLDFHLMNSSSSLFDIFTGGCLGRPIQKSLLVHWHRTNTYQTLAHNIRAPKFCVFPKVGWYYEIWHCSMFTIPLSFFIFQQSSNYTVECPLSLFFIPSQAIPGQLTYVVRR